MEHGEAIERMLASLLAHDTELRRKVVECAEPVAAMLLPLILKAEPATWFYNGGIPARRFAWRYDLGEALRMAYAIAFGGFAEDDDDEDDAAPTPAATPLLEFGVFAQEMCAMIAHRLEEHFPRDNHFAIVFQQVQPAAAATAVVALDSQLKRTKKTAAVATAPKIFFELRWSHELAPAPGSAASAEQEEGEDEVREQ